MKAFRIKRIKSFEDSGEIVLKPLTIFVGRNSCGKSSLIRFPVVLSQTCLADSDSPIKFYGKQVDYGNYEDVLHNNSSGGICFELKYDLDVYTDWKELRRMNRIRRMIGENSYDKEDNREVKVEVTIERKNNRLITTKIELYVDEMRLYTITRINRKKYRFHNYLKYERGEFKRFDKFIDLGIIGFEKFIPIIEFKDQIEEINKKYSSSQSGEENLSSVIRNLYSHRVSDTQNLSDEERKLLDIFRAFEYSIGLLKDVYEKYRDESLYLKYIGPFRIDPERYYRDLEYNSKDVGVHGENTSNILIRDFRRKDQSLIKHISKWTKRVLGYEIIIKNISNGMFQVMLRDKMGIETNIIDNGYGISQVLPIVTEVIRLATFNPKKMREDRVELITILEQPELHLHPAAQSELADLLVDGIADGAGLKKIIVETHSEHLIRKLQILVANNERNLTNDMVAIYYVDKDNKGNAFVEEMKMMEDGKFENPWPSGFFDRGYQLSKELARAGKIY